MVIQRFSDSSVFARYPLFNQGHTQPGLGNLGRCIIVPRKSDIKRERIMSTEQATTAIDMADGNTKLMLKILFYLGLRISECRKLKRRDITLRRGSLHFQVLGKGRKQRTVIMGPKTSAAILPELPAVGYLFPGRNGCMTSVGLEACEKGDETHSSARISPLFPTYIRHYMFAQWMRSCHSIETARAFRREDYVPVFA